VPTCAKPSCRASGADASFSGPIESTSSRTPRAVAQSISAAHASRAMPRRRQGSKTV
jgi:hypothetical protein